MITAPLEYVLEAITNKPIRAFARKCLEDADPILNTIPASVSGKYHPVECCKPGGLVVHIQRACYFTFMFIKSHKYETDLRGDILLTSILLHDIAKKERYSGNEYTMHPINAAKMIESNKDMIPEKVFKIIQSCVKYHMGPWTPTSFKKEMYSYTHLEMLTYLADYLASQKTIVIEN